LGAGHNIWPKRDDVTEEWRKQHNEELNDLYSLPNNVRVIKSRMRWTGHVARIGEKRGACRVLVGKTEGKKPLGRLRHRWEDIKMNVHEVSNYECGSEHSGSITCVECLD
jgi:hypothetical protein